MHEHVAPPRVSVCITTYGHDAFIEACVRSVLDQAADATLEVLVGEDASPDGTRKILRRLADGEPRLRLVLHDRNVGPTRNLSGLVTMASGDFIAHLDGDDLWYPGKLAAQLERLASDPAMVACYSNALVVEGDGSVLGTFSRGLPSTLGSHDLLRRGNRLCHSSLIYRARDRDAILGVAPPYIDYRLHLRLLARGRLGYVDAPLVGYRWRTPGSMTTTMPSALVDGHLDAFQEALIAKAAPEDILGAIGAFWGKVLVKGLLGLNLATPRQVAEALRGLGVPGLTSSWLARQSLLALPRALRSVLSRRLPPRVYFP